MVLIYLILNGCLPLEHRFGTVQTLLPTETDIYILNGGIGRFIPVLLLRINPAGDLDLVVDLGCLAIVIVIGEIHVEFGLHLGCVVFCRGPGILAIGQYTRLQFKYPVTAIFAR